MNGFVQGIYSVCDALQPVAAAVLVLMLIVAGLTAIIGGAEAAPKFKETIKWILIGAGVVFTAASLGKMIMGWFVS